MNSDDKKNKSSAREKGDNEVKELEEFIRLKDKQNTVLEKLLENLKQDQKNKGEDN